ncbi:DoxX family membrane protein [Dyella telluris]|uniref:DoxX family membrane protein n=1 Tax=Dyella telluris TaxID=2763498 RepID=A0A7G8Q9U8_9GAMM|nr:DoxX family membrane protein [Dyella telluris]QNK03556.1 DoxX family membrane protein [Dyella telluris]
MERSYHASSSVLADDTAVARPSAPTFVSQQFLAISMMTLGVLGLVYGDVAMVWQHLPIEHMPGARAIAYGFALIELIAGIGLLLRPWAKAAAALLTVFLLAWAVLLKLPAVIAVPSMEATWLGLGEITVILAGAWVLFASQMGERGDWLGHVTGQRGVRAARVLFALSLPMIGLSHFFYTKQTVELVPSWLPFPSAWAYLTGAGSIATCVAVLFGIVPRLACRLEALMLWIITLLVWAPAIISTSGDRLPITALTISAAIACGAWVVADSYRGTDYLPPAS